MFSVANSCFVSRLNFFYGNFHFLISFASVLPLRNFYEFLKIHKLFFKNLIDDRNQALSNDESKTLSNELLLCKGVVREIKIASNSRFFNNSLNGNYVSFYLVFIQLTLQFTYRDPAVSVRLYSPFNS